MKLSTYCIFLVILPNWLYFFSFFVSIKDTFLNIHSGLNCNTLFFFQFSWRTKKSIRTLVTLLLISVSDTQTYYPWEQRGNNNPYLNIHSLSALGMLPSCPGMAFWEQQEVGKGTGRETFLDNLLPIQYSEILPSWHVSPRGTVWRIGTWKYSCWVPCWQRARYITRSSETHNKDDEMFRFWAADLQEKVKRMKYVYNLVNWEKMGMVIDWKYSEALALRLAETNRWRPDQRGRGQGSRKGGGHPTNWDALWPACRANTSLQTPVTQKWIREEWENIFLSGNIRTSNMSNSFPNGSERPTSDEE